MNCDICDGSGIIRLPVRRKMLFDTNDFPNLEVREYPCPECGHQIPLENVEILQTERVVPKEENRFYDYIKDSIGRQIGQKLVDDGYIKFSKTIEKDRIAVYDKYRIRAKLGVLLPKFVKSFEDRVKENSKNIAEIIIQDIIKEVRNWRGLYNDTEIAKETVIRICYEILDHFERCR